MLLNNTRSLVVLAALSLSFVLAGASQITQQNGERLQRKIDEIAKNAETEPVPQKQTSITQDEINSYFAFHVKEKIPQGLSHPEINLLGDNRVSGRVVVDIDEFKRYRGSHGLTDPFFYLSGKAPVRARGVLHARNGSGQFQLEYAEVHGCHPREVSQPAPR